ncbi:MAG TPA: hypothetical protein VF297_17155 [Pyrinomonadaceae bacterium]
MEGPILVIGAVGRTVTELLLRQGRAVRAMVRNEDERGNINFRCEMRRR